MATAKIQTGLRLDEEIYGKLKTLCNQEGRSINNMVEYIIRKYLADYEATYGVLPECQD